VNYNFGYLLVSRNNSPMIFEWAKNNRIDNRLVINLDESTSDEQRVRCQTECRKIGIHYELAEPGGLVRNLKQAARYFQRNGIPYILYMHHDAYPESEKSLNDIVRFINQNDLSIFGLIGFNVVHGAEAIGKHPTGKNCLHTLARAPLEKGDGWYRPLPTSRINHRLIKLIPFAVESVMWSTVLLSCRVIEENLKEDERFVFFHAMDDAAFQLLSQRMYNLVIPSITFMHNQASKIKHGLPENSPQKLTDGEQVSFYYGRDDHLLNWEQKWNFRWDFRKVLQTQLIPSRYQSYVNRLMGRINRQFKFDPLNGFETIARRDFVKNCKIYEGTLLNEFYEHDPINGPLRYFSELQVPIAN
jgi:hypothetical protein